MSHAMSGSESSNWFWSSIGNIALGQTVDTESCRKGLDVTIIRAITDNVTLGYYLRLEHPLLPNCWLENVQYGTVRQPRVEAKRPTVRSNTGRREDSVAAGKDVPPGNPIECNNNTEEGHGGEQSRQQQEGKIVHRLLSQSYNMIEELQHEYKQLHGEQA